MKNKNSCSADVHERVDKGFGPLNENLGRSLMCVVMILGFIFGLSGGVSAYTPLGGGVCNCGDGNALDLTFTFNRAIPSPDSNVFALGFGDDGFLWVHSPESKIIYKLDPVTGSAIQSFPSGITTSLSDIDVREGILYGGGEPTIFRYDTSSGEPLSSLTGPVVGGSRGLTFVGADLYVSGVLDGLPWVQLGRVDPLTGSLLGSSAPPDLVYSYGIGAIGQNVGYLVNPLFEYGDVTLYIVDPAPGNLIESHVLFEGDDDIRSLDASTTELFISRRDLNQIWVYDIEGLISQPEVSISTDSFEYSPGDTMTVTLDLANPTIDPVTFEWYIGVPQSDIWVTYASAPIPAGFDNSYTIPIPVGDWGPTPFGLVHYVRMLDPVSGDVLVQDVALCAYSPGVGEAMPVDVKREIMKTIERVEFSI